MVLMCLDCRKKQANFGMPEVRKKVWCGGCASSHAGSVSLKVHKLCQSCHSKYPTYGLPDERRKRWCASCGKRNGGVNKSSCKMCQDCGLKHAGFGSERDHIKRWCGRCSKSHGKGVVYLVTRRKCETCGEKLAINGLPGEHRNRWCGSCSKLGPAAVFLRPPKKPIRKADQTLRQAAVQAAAMAAARQRESQASSRATAGLDEREGVPEWASATIKKESPDGGALHDLASLAAAAAPTPSAHQRGRTAGQEGAIQLAPTGSTHYPAAQLTHTATSSGWLPGATPYTYTPPAVPPPSGGDSAGRSGGSDGGGGGWHPMQTTGYLHAPPAPGLLRAPPGASRLAPVVQQLLHVNVQTGYT
jgi:hypothetical protein